MALFDWLFGTRPLAVETLEPVAGKTFAVTDLMPFTGTYVDPVASAVRISRTAARSVPAVKRARDIICGTLGTIPLQLVDTQNVTSVSSLLNQPEANVARSVTITRLYEDLLYDGVAWWRRVQNDYRGYPMSVVRVEPERVSINDGVLYVDGVRTNNASMIRFDSPNAPLLVDGARAIRTLLRLEASAANYADDPMPQGYFRPADGETDPADDADITAVLNGWKTARQTKVTGYVPASLKYETVQWSPEQLQLIEARQHAVLEIARLTGIDAEDLSVSTTSRTYLNGQDRRLQRIADVLGPYATAVTDRLRMPDVTPRGYEARADFSGFLRADDKTRLENYQLALQMRLLTLADVAAREGLPEPLPGPALTSTQVDLPKEIDA